MVRSIPTAGPVSNDCSAAKMISSSTGCSMASRLLRMALLISSSESEPLPVFRLEPSRPLCALILGPVAIACGLIGLSGGLSLSFKLMAAVGCLVIAAVAWQRHWPRQRRAVRAFGPLGGGQWWVETAAGQRWQGELSDAVVWPTLVFFSLKSGWRYRGVMVPCDALSGEAHRQLRRLLMAR